MKWIKFKDQQPPSGKRVLVIKQWLDAPYSEHGYENDKSFWTNPMIVIDISWNGTCWSDGGKGDYWMILPDMPDEMDKTNNL